MLSYDDLYSRALERHGEDKLEERMPGHLDADGLREIGDDRYLSAMSACLFAAGFRWRVVEAKWPDFEEAFDRGVRAADEIVAARAPAPAEVGVEASEATEAT